MSSYLKAWRRCMRIV